ncbi:hypothetical protein [Sphingobium sp. YR768]|uniref:hypothetical protein n=1 Tax=Sphingobium sp. YR768 TaxID=1884365 RepID=UPI000B849241|nr:hypothetical protein [Sphingobium sp. YR768]
MFGGQFQRGNPIDDALAQANAPFANSLQQPMPAPQPQQQASKFGARDIVGILGDALAAAGGGQGVYTQMKLRDRDVARQQQAAETQRQRERDDWLWKQQWERDNPKPVNNDTVADFNFIASQIGPEAAQSYLRNKADPVVSIPVPGGTYLGPRSGIGSTIGKEGDPTSGGAGGGNASSPSGSFMSVDQYRSMRQSMGAGYDAWSRKYNVPVLVNSPEEMAGLPSGTPVVSADGRRGVKK